MLIPIAPVKYCEMAVQPCIRLALRVEPSVSFGELFVVQANRPSRIRASE
jgi:hypothetical protein